MPLNNELIYGFRRDVHDVVHKVVAVGSRSVVSAQKFIDEKAGGDKSIKALGSYAAVFADPVGSFLPCFY